MIVPPAVMVLTGQQKMLDLITNVPINQSRNYHQLITHQQLARPAKEPTDQLRGKVLKLNVKHQTESQTETQTTNNHIKWPPVKIVRTEDSNQLGLVSVILCTQVTSTLFWLKRGQEGAGGGWRVSTFNF